MPIGARNLQEYKQQIRFRTSKENDNGRLIDPRAGSFSMRHQKKIITEGRSKNTRTDKQLEPCEAQLTEEPDLNFIDRGGKTFIEYCISDSYDIEMEGLN